MKKYTFCTKAAYEKIAIIMTGLFLVSLLPVLYCSFFDYANGDDLWEGAAAYRVLVNKGSVGEFFRAIFEWVKVDYFGWEGNWSSIILWCLEPSIWGEKVYCITPWIALLFLCGGNSYFLFHYLKKYLSCPTSFCMIVTAIVCLFSVQYMPNIRCGIFWYTGMINYVVPYGLCLLSFVWMDQFLDMGRKRYLVLTALSFAYLGGAGYPPIVLAFEILLFMLLLTGFCQEPERKRRRYWLLIPLVLLLAGFIVSALSPGNAVRGGDSYYFSVTRIFQTILECIRQGFLGAVHWFLSVRPLILSVPLLIIATWEQIEPEKCRLRFTHPALALLFLFLVSSSVYAPGIYAQSEVSGGVPDTIYFVFLLTMIAGIIYLTCWVKSSLIKKGFPPFEKCFLEKVRVLIVLSELLFCIVAGKYLIGNMTDYICMQFIASGQLRDFEDQMQERLAILHNPEITDVILPEMNNEQGPFMHMALLKDPNAYTNQATARFYGKNSVIAIPRAEYCELYGDLEE